MRITDIKAVYPRWPRKAGPVWQSCFWQIVVRVDTDCGVSGHGVGGGGEPATLVINQHLRHHLVGHEIRSPEDIKDTWDTLYGASSPYGRGGLALMALSGIDLALWDLLGKAEGKAVHELIGPRTKERVRAYATGQDFAIARDKGFSTLKFTHKWIDDSGYDTAEQMASQARDIIGPDLMLLADCYMSWSPTVVPEMARRLAPYNIYWFEDTCTPDHLDELAALRPQIKPVLLAGGEHDFSHFAFDRMARAGALDLWQPDITWCGGITAGLRIMDTARAHGIPVVPHRGGEIWGLHLIVATDCDDLAEAHSDQWITEGEKLWFGMPQVEDGCLRPNESPGFGVTVNEDLL